MQAVATAKKHSKKKATGAHYTPKDLASFLAQRLTEYIPDRSLLRVLDPACGDGELLEALALALPSEFEDDCQFLGIDQDDEALLALSRRWRHGLIETRSDDFLSLSFDRDPTPRLFEDENVLPPVDVIIANPPYVRTQVLGSARAQQLAMAFDLSGRVDLYHAFLVAMTKALKPGGLLGVITSNRFLTTKGGAAVRQFLATNYEVLELIDLGDTKLFEAAVLPAIFIGRKRSGAISKKIPSFLRIYEEFTPPPYSRHAHSIYEVLAIGEDGHYQVGKQFYKLTNGHLNISEPVEPWKLVCHSEQDWLNRFDANARYKLSDLLNIKVGIKTTADKVFIREDWERLERSLRPESELLQPIIDSFDCARYAIDSSGLKKKVLYPYTVVESKRATVNLNSYPFAKNYLEHYGERLKSRTYLQGTSREWFEIWVPHHPDAWQQPMLVVPDISPTPRFLFTAEGALVNGNCYWMTTKPGVPRDYLYLVLGIANSEFMTRYHDLCFNNKLYSGRRRYLTQYLEKYPIPDLHHRHSAEIIRLVQKRILTTLREEQIQLEECINSEVGKLYGLF